MQTDGQSQADQAGHEGGRPLLQGKALASPLCCAMCCAALCCAVLRGVACVVECNGRVAGRRHSLPQLKHPLELIHPYSLAEESGELINAYLPLPFHISRLQFRLCILPLLYSSTFIA